MLKICKNYVKPMQKIYSLCRVYIFQIYAQYELWSLARDSGAGPSPAGHWAAGCCRVTESVLLPTRSPSTGLCRCHRARRHSDWLGDARAGVITDSKSDPSAKSLVHNLHNFCILENDLHKLHIWHIFLHILHFVCLLDVCIFVCILFIFLLIFGIFLHIFLHIWCIFDAYLMHICLHIVHIFCILCIFFAYCAYKLKFCINSTESA